MSDLSTANEIDKTPQKSSNSHDTENDKESNGKSSSVIKSPRISSVAKKQQKEAEKAEKLRLKEEKDKQKLEEKMKKEKEKNDLKLKKESERLEKEREKEEKRKQKDEERRIRHEQVEEEKKKKEEAKQEERKKKEEDKRKEEERMEKKSQKEKELMKNFFIKATKEATQTQQNATPSNEVGPFMPFEVKPEMRLAPLVRFDRENVETCRAKLDKIMSKQVCSIDYLHELRSGLRKPGKSSKTWPQDEEVEIVPVESILSVGSAPPIKRKMKLLQFHDNYRPAYYGTWSKVSRVVTPKQPLAKDSAAFDYEVDSDEEWEEEEPGESISHSEGEEDGGEEDAGNDDNEDKFFVPHGYLSEGEGCDDDDEEDLSPETLKQKQQIRARNWEVEMKENVERLRPISIGVIKWQDKPKLSEDQLDFLKKFMAQPIDVTFPITEEEILKESAEMISENKTNDKRFRVQGVPEEAMPDLIRLVHGCGSGIDKMCREFKLFWTKNNSEAESEDSEKSTISKRQLEVRIREIASYKRESAHHSHRLWYVSGDVLEKYGLTAAPVPSEWMWSSMPSAKKLPQISTPMCETPKHDKTLKEMKTPKISASSLTPSCSGTKKNPSASSSIKKFMTPVADAVSSERSAKRRVCTTFLSGPAPSPGENANLSSSFISRLNQRKRSSSGDIVSESKRMRNEPVLEQEESSQDCLIVEGPVPVVNSNKKAASCFVQLFKCNGENRAKMDSDLKDAPLVDDEDDDVMITDLPDENGGVELKPSRTSEATTVRSKTLTKFFKTLSPLNK